MKIEASQVEEAAKELYIRALKLLPPDIKQGFSGLAARETDSTAQSVLGTMIRNITVAEDTDNLLCQDTGIPIYTVWIGRGVEIDGVTLKAAIHSQRRSGAWLTSSITVASADGPAIAGMASGTISGSPCRSAASSAAGAEKSCAAQSKKGSRHRQSAATARSGSSPAKNRHP